ncbi:MAG: hypothetical protein ACE5KD_00550 [Candidatus Bathyarchaeia archaeon]
MFTAVAIFSLFFGIISTIIIDILVIIATPFNPEAYKTLALDLGRTVLNSQGSISESVKEFGKTESMEFKTFLLSRIAAGSLLTIGMIWVFYKILRWFVESPSVSTKLLFIVIAVSLVWFVGLFTSIFIGKLTWIPFSGWIDLARNREIIIGFILEQYQEKVPTNQTNV